MNLKNLIKLVLNVWFFFNFNWVCFLEKFWIIYILVNKMIIVLFFYGEGGGVGKGYVLFVVVVLYFYLL